jgi:hypothetical protein
MIYDIKIVANKFGLIETGSYAFNISKFIFNRKNNSFVVTGANNLGVINHITGDITDLCKFSEIENVSVSNGDMTKTGTYPFNYTNDPNYRPEIALNILLENKKADRFYYEFFQNTPINNVAIEHGSINSKNPLDFKTPVLFKAQLELSRVTLGLTDTTYTNDYRLSDLFGFDGLFNGINKNKLEYYTGQFIINNIDNSVPYSVNFDYKKTEYNFF